jgi:hypothetical protein
MGILHKDLNSILYLSFWTCNRFWVYFTITIRHKYHSLYFTFTTMLLHGLNALWVGRSRLAIDPDFQKTQWCRDIVIRYRTPDIRYSRIFSAPTLLSCAYVRAMFTCTIEHVRPHAHRCRNVDCFKYAFANTVGIFIVLSLNEHSCAYWRGS